MRLPEASELDWRNFRSCLPTVSLPSTPKHHRRRKNGKMKQGNKGVYSFQNTHILPSWPQHTRPISLDHPRKLVEYRKPTERKISSKKLISQKNVKKSETEKEILEFFSFFWLLFLLAKVKRLLSSFAFLPLHYNYWFICLQFLGFFFLDRSYFGNAEYLLLMFILTCFFNFQKYSYSSCLYIFFH